MEALVTATGLEVCGLQREQEVRPSRRKEWNRPDISMSETSELNLGRQHRCETGALEKEEIEQKAFVTRVIKSHESMERKIEMPGKQMML